MSTDFTLWGLIFTLLCYLAGGIIPLFIPARYRVMASAVFAAIASLSGIATSLLILITRQEPHFYLPIMYPSDSIELKVDALSAFFLLIISAVGFSASLFMQGYIKREYETPHLKKEGHFKKPGQGLLAPGLNIFLLSMILVVSANNALLFLIVWEVMSLISFFLVMYEHEHTETRDAGMLYLIMTHAGTAFIIILFLILYSYSGDLSFNSFHIGNGVPEWIKSIAFVSALIGFGTKAGVAPLHIWLPKAHPVAPSHISALMSGVMIKMGVYGLIRTVFYFLDPAATWWGVVILILGILSAFIGVLSSLLGQDVKKLLAYSSVENIGIILMGLGPAVIFMSMGQHGLALLALMAALYHTLNHALFKGLLFLCTGSVVSSIHTRHIEAMGGLIKKMPWTSLFFFVGALSISALPPFNGFVGEWLTYQALFAGHSMTNKFVAVLLPATAIILALIGSLVVASFTRAFSMIFLARPRSVRMESAGEATAGMKFAMGFLAILCIATGLFPSGVITLLEPVNSGLFGTGSAGQHGLTWGLGIIPVVGGYTLNLSPLLIGIAGMGVIAITILILMAILGKGSMRLCGTWNCGTPVTKQMEYTAYAFSRPLARVFERFHSRVEKVDIEKEVSSYTIKSISIEHQSPDIFEHQLYDPATKGWIRFAHLCIRFERTSLQAYLSYILGVFVLLLIYLTIWRGL